MKRATLSLLFPLVALPVGALGGAGFTVLCGLVQSTLSNPPAPLADWALRGLLAGAAAGGLVGLLRAVDRWLTASPREAAGEAPGRSAGHAPHFARIGRNQWAGSRGALGARRG